MPCLRNERRLGDGASGLAGRALFAVTIHAMSSCPADSASGKRVSAFGDDPSRKRSGSRTGSNFLAAALSWVARNLWRRRRQPRFQLPLQASTDALCVAKELAWHLPQVGPQISELSPKLPPQAISAPRRASSRRSRNRCANYNRQLQRDQPASRWL
jgi:hypothetical protein